jgi:vacuolar-type H+-ATPase subunit H
MQEDALARVGSAEEAFQRRIEELQDEHCRQLKVAQRQAAPRTAGKDAANVQRLTKELDKSTEEAALRTYNGQGILTAFNRGFRPSILSILCGFG